MTSKSCLSPQCLNTGKITSFKLKGINTLIKRAEERGDEDFQEELQLLLASKGDSATIEMHKNCYCTYTSKQNVMCGAPSSAKRSAVSSGNDVPVKIISRSHVQDFSFTVDCVLCNEVCKDKDQKNPARWDRIIQCEQKGRNDAKPIKDVFIEIA